MNIMNDLFLRENVDLSNFNKKVNCLDFLRWCSYRDGVLKYVSGYFLVEFPAVALCQEFLKWVSPPISAKA